MHEDAVHNNIKHQCPHCDYQASYKRQLKIHESVTHNIKRTFLYFCKNCDSNHYKKIRTFLCDFKCKKWTTNLRSHVEDEKNDAFDDLLNTPEAFAEEKILDYDVGTDNVEISTKFNLNCSIHALEGKVSDDYLEADLEIEEDFLDLRSHQRDAFAEEKNDDLLDTKELGNIRSHQRDTHVEEGAFAEEKILDTPELGYDDDLFTDWNEHFLILKQNYIFVKAQPSSSQAKA